MANTPYYTKPETDALITNYNREEINELKQMMEALGSGEGGIIYDTLAAAQAVDPKPVNGTIFQVSDITDPTNAGLYSFQSTETGGTRFERPFIQTTGTVTEGAVEVPTSAAVFNFAMSQEEYTEEGKNLLDKEQIIMGFYNAGGAYNPNVNRITTARIPVTVGETYTYSCPAGVINTSTNRFHYWDADDDWVSEVLSNGLNNQTITVPSGVTSVTVQMANVTDIGLTPTDNAFADSAMLEVGAVANAYETYGRKIKKDTISGLLGIEATLDEAVIDIEEDRETLNVLLEEYDVYSHFNGVDARVPLGLTLTLAADGDYLEFEARTGTGWTSFNDTLGMFGINGSPNTFGIYDANTYYLRTVSGSDFIVFGGLPNLIGEFRKIKLAVSGGATSWDLYVDDVLVTSNPKTNNFLITEVGRCYSGANNYALFDLKYANISVSGNVTAMPDPSVYPNQENVIKEYQKKANAAAELSPVYVSCNPTGYNTRELITFYVRRGNSSRYIGHFVRHDYDMDDLVYSDQFRIAYAHEYSYAGGVMTLVASNTLQGGESECVYQQIQTPSPKADFTGGVHGDEVYESFGLYLDGVKKDIDVAFDLIPCKSAHYTQKSTMHEAPNVGPTPVVGHPEQAIHYKKTVFGDSGYTTYNVLEWIVSIEIFWYHGISCIGKMQATEAYDEEFQVEAMTASNVFKFEKVNQRLIEYYNTTTSNAASVTATIDSATFADNLCEVFVDDRNVDSKYYRMTTQEDTVIGQKDSSVMKVTYHRLEE